VRANVGRVLGGTNEEGRIGDGDGVDRDWETRSFEPESMAGDEGVRLAVDTLLFH